LSKQPGAVQPRRVDYEYQRNGTANLFMMFAPLEGWRGVKVTDQRAAVDYAQVLRDLSDTHFPKASKIVLVQDNPPSVPMTVRQRAPGILDLRARKDDLADAHAPHSE
jgi:hypothetical protein